MPRGPRPVVAGLPHHVTQRGVDGMAIFRDDTDRRRFCHLLKDAVDRHAVALHAYVLMDNHVHLLLTPARTDGLGRAMKRCGQLYAREFNRRHDRTGTLVQRRFHSSIVQSGRYFLEVLRYIELNPVRAGMVADARDHPWSSVHVPLGRVAEPMVRIHPEFERLGATGEARADAYSTWLAAGTPDERLKSIRAHLRQGRAFGNESFGRSVASMTGRPALLRARGRPLASGRKTGCTPVDVQPVRKSLLKENVPF